MQQYVGPFFCPRGQNILRLVMANSLLAGDENHAGGRDLADIAGIVAGAGDHASGAVAEHLNRLLAARQTLGVEGDWRVVKNALDLRLHPASGQRVGSIGRHRLLLESIKPLNSTIDEVSAHQLVALMKGKTLSYQNILSAIKKHHPDAEITLRDLQKRISTMLASNHVGIIRHDDMPVPHFTLTSVDPRYYANSEKTRA